MLCLSSSALLFPCKKIPLYRFTQNRNAEATRKKSNGLSRTSLQTRRKVLPFSSLFHWFLPVFFCDEKYEIEQRSLSYGGHPETTTTATTRRTTTTRGHFSTTLLSQCNQLGNGAEEQESILSPFFIYFHQPRQNSSTFHPMNPPIYSYCEAL